MAGHIRNWPISKPSFELAAKMAVILAGSQELQPIYIYQSGALSPMVKRINPASILSILLESLQPDVALIKQLYSEDGFALLQNKDAC